MLETLLHFLNSSGFSHVTWGNLVMIGVGLLFIFLAIRKGFEPLLLVPIGFGILIGNIPYNYQEVSLSVYDGPVSPEKVRYFSTQDLEIEGQFYPAYTQVPDRGAAHDLVHDTRVIMVHSEEYLSVNRGYPVPFSDVETTATNPLMTVVNQAQQGQITKVDAPGVYLTPKGGHLFFRPAVFEDPNAQEEAEHGRYRVVIEPSRQNTWNASVLWMLYRGIEWGFYPPLIFLGIGALIDFGPLLANPRLILLGAAAQAGIFGALLLALLFGFDMNEASSIGIIGGADGPTAIFTCTRLAPHLLGAVALSAYSYMAMVPIIQPPIMRLLTTRKERLIRMAPPKDVSRPVRVIFPIVGFLLTAFIANGALPLLGMLFFGNLLRECLVTDRLSKTAQTTFIDIVTILLGLTVGAKTQASNFLTVQTVQVFLLGIIAFSVATAGGVVFAKVMNLFTKDKVNPLIGAAGVSAVPMSARVVQKVAHEEDKQNFLLMHAMGPNVAGVIGSAVAAGVLLSYAAG